MIRSEALALLSVADGAPANEIRDAYLRRAAAVRLDADPDGFMGLREAFELLTRGAGTAGEEVAAARARVAAEPDSTETRWRLLSCLRYTEGPEASSVLRDGAQRQPEAFLDELMFHFPERTPGELLDRASDAAGSARLLLIADVHATEARPAQALQALGAALRGTTGASLSASALLRLAVRPVFSLQIHAQLQRAVEAFALLQQKLASQISEASAADFQTATIFEVAAELGRLDETFPLDLRQVAALAAKRGDFQNAPYEARFATRLLQPPEVGALNERLKRDAPALAGILGLSLTEEQLRPERMPTVKISGGWAALPILVAILGSSAVHDWERSRHSERFLSDITISSVNDADRSKKQIERDCADPGSDECRRWVAFVPSWIEAPDTGGAAPDPDGFGNPAPSSPDVGIRLEDLPTIGTPGESLPTRRRPRNHRK